MLDMQPVRREQTWCPPSSKVKWKERETEDDHLHHLLETSQTAVARNFRRWSDLAKIESAEARNITNSCGKKLQEVVRLSQD